MTVPINRARTPVWTNGGERIDATLAARDPHSDHLNAAWWVSLFDRVDLPVCWFCERRERSLYAIVGVFGDLSLRSLRLIVFFSLKPCLARRHPVALGKDGCCALVNLERTTRRKRTTNPKRLISFKFLLTNPLRAVQRKTRALLGKFSVYIFKLLSFLFVCWISSLNMDTFYSVYSLRISLI